MKLFSWINAHWQHAFTGANQRRAAWLFVGLGLLPFLVLSIYSHPALDDFSDAVLRQRQSFWECQAYLYQHWTGRYTTSLLLTELSPVYHHWLRLYWLVPVGALLALAAGGYALVAALAGRQWTTGGKALAVGILLTLWLQQASSVAEILYWYNGVAVYTLPVALLLGWLALLIRYWQQPPGSPATRPLLLASAALGVVLVGTNELIALPLCAAMGLLLLWAFYRQDARRFGLLALVGLLAVALLVSFLAPGNMARATLINRSVSLIWVVVGPFSASAYLLLNWLSSGLLIGSSLLVLPALARLAAAPRLSWLGRFHPLLLAALLLGLLALSEVPSYWATGGLVPPRGRAMLYLLFLVGWFGLMLVGLVRWQTAVARYLQGPLLAFGGWAPPASAALWAWLLLSFLADHNVRQLRPQMGQGSNNIVVAYREWLNGTARRYDAQLSRRYHSLRTGATARQQLPPLTARPATLLYYDITTDSAYWGNTAYARYFGKKAVWIGPGGDAPHP